jgi:hypothetical protein
MSTYPFVLLATKLDEFSWTAWTMTLTIPLNLAASPGPYEHLPIRMSEYPFALYLPFTPLAFIRTAIWPSTDAIAVLLITPPSAYVRPPISIDACPLALHLTVDEQAFIEVS